MRVLHPKTPFRIALTRLAPRGSSAYLAVIGVLRTFLDERTPLVTPDDRVVRRGVNVMGRPVPGTPLIVCYVPAGEDVLVIDLLEDR